MAFAASSPSGTAPDIPMRLYGAFGKSPTLKGTIKTQPKILPGMYQGAGWSMIAIETQTELENRTLCLQHRPAEDKVPLTEAKRSSYSQNPLRRRQPAVLIHDEKATDFIPNGPLEDAFFAQRLKPRITRLPEPVCLA